MMPIQRVELTLPVTGLEKPVKAGFISDTHLRSDREVETLLEAMRSLEAPLLLLGGDYVESRKFIPGFCAAISSLGKKVLAVFGNNDVAMKKFFFAAEQGPLRFLQDESAEFDGLRILGVHDHQEGQWLHRAFPPPPVVVLAHSPDALFGLPREIPFTFLAGHVHGGQFRIPGWKRWWTHTAIGRAHAEGRSRRGRNEIFVGRGIGYSLLPLRNVPAEIYDITFVPAEEIS